MKERKHLLAQSHILTKNKAEILVNAATRRRDSTLFLPMRILPRAKRKALMVLYDFCRAADDAADNISDFLQAQSALAFWEEEIQRIYRHQKARHPITAALAGVIRTHALPEQHFLVMLEGFAMDLRGEMAAPDLAKVELYCDRVAAAVGFLSLPIFSVPETEAKIFAHHLAHGLQCINILRDIAVDAAQQRCYLPQEFLFRHGISAFTADVLVNQSGALRLVCEDMARLARHHFALARVHLPLRYKRRLFSALYMMTLYEALLKRLEKEGWPWRNPPAPLPWQDHATAAWRGVVEALRIT